MTGTRPPAITFAGSVTGVVALGSALGAVLRFIVSAAMTQPGDDMLMRAGIDDIGATLAVNVVGSFVIGLVAVLAVRPGITRSPLLHHFVVTGFCGGFTTFSVFSIEALALFRGGAPVMAVVLVCISLLAWLAAAGAGSRLGAWLSRR